MAQTFYNRRTGRLEGDPPMKTGDEFSFEGYTLVAHANLLRSGGEACNAVVLNNNSTHYLVALSNAWMVRGRLVASLRYGTGSDESDWTEAYARALAVLQNEVWKP